MLPASVRRADGEPSGGRTVRFRNGGMLRPREDSGMDGRLVGIVVLALVGLGVIVTLVMWGEERQWARSPTGLARRSRHSFRLVRPGRINRWFRRRWLAPAALSGDPDFDGEWSADSRDRELMAALVSRPEVRDLLRSLARLEFTVVEQTRSSLRLRPMRARGKLSRNEERAEGARRALVQLDALITEVSGTRDFPHRRTSWRVFAVTACFLATMSLLCVRFFIKRSDVPQPPQDTLMLLSLAAGMPLALLSTVAFGRFLKGHAGPHEEIVAPVLGMAFACFFGVGIGAAELNARFDPGPVSRLEGSVVRVLRGPAHGGRGDVLVATVPGRRETITVPMSAKRTAGIVPGRSVVRIDTSPGWLGIERWLAVDVLPDADIGSGR